MARTRHPDKHIEKAIQYAEAQGWYVVKSNGHAWGRLLCQHEGRDGCKFSVWSTPNNPESFARHIRREVDSCTHFERDNETEKNNEDQEET